MKMKQEKMRKIGIASALGLVVLVMLGLYGASNYMLNYSLIKLPMYSVFSLYSDIYYMIQFYVSEEYIFIVTLIYGICLL